MAHLDESDASRFQSWNPSSIQLGLSWRWEPSSPARHSRWHEGRRLSECPVTVQRDTYDFRGFCSIGLPCCWFTLEGGAGTGRCPEWTVSPWISGEQWPIVFHLPTSPKKSRVGCFASASMMLGAEASNWATWSHRTRTSCRVWRWGSPTQCG